MELLSTVGEDPGSLSAKLPLRVSGSVVSTSGAGSFAAVVSAPEAQCRERIGGTLCLYHVLSVGRGHADWSGVFAECLFATRRGRAR